MQIIAGGLEHPQVQALLEAHLRSRGWAIEAIRLKVQRKQSP